MNINSTYFSSADISAMLFRSNQTKVLLSFIFLLPILFAPISGGDYFSARNLLQQLKNISRSGKNLYPASVMPPVQSEPESSDQDPANQSPAAGDPTADSALGATDENGFYGITVNKSSNVIFIIDKSGSMADKINKGSQQKRINVLRGELSRSIKIRSKDKNPSGGFMIVAFDRKVKLFPRKKLCRYTDAESMKKAERFIRKLHSGGLTDPRSGWRIALKLCQTNKINTVFFMSDGNTGLLFKNQWLEKKLQEKKLQHLVVHCISVGNDNPLMQSIARQYNGKYVCIQ